MTEVNVRVREMLEESGMSGTDQELFELLVGLEEQYVDIPVLEPGPQLATLLGGGVTGSSRVHPLLGRRRVVAVGALALSAVLTTGVAAANELPPPAQRWISEFSERFLPFDLPGPEDRASGAGEHRRDADDRGSPGSRAESDEDRSDQPAAEPPDQTSGSRPPKVSGRTSLHETSTDSDESGTDGGDSDAREDASEGNQERTREERPRHSDSDEGDEGSASKVSGEETPSVPSSSDESGDSEDAEESGDGQSTDAGDAEDSHDTEASQDR